MLLVAAFYLWLVKHISYRKLVEIQRRQRARKDKVPSVKPAAGQEGPYHTSQIAIEKECRYETDIFLGKRALSVVISSLKSAEFFNVQPDSTYTDR